MGRGGTQAWSPRSTVARRRAPVDLAELAARCSNPGTDHQTLAVLYAELEEGLTAAALVRRHVSDDSDPDFYDTRTDHYATAGGVDVIAVTKTLYRSGLGVLRVTLIATPE